MIKKKQNQGSILNFHNCFISQENSFIAGVIIVLKLIYSNVKIYEL